MGIETVAAVVGIVAAVDGMVQSHKNRAGTEGMSWGAANEKASATINPMYDTRMKDVLKNVQNDLIGRGFSGQKAGTELSTETAAENERQRISAINDYAAQLHQNAAATALTQQQINNQQMSASLAALQKGADWFASQYTVPGVQSGSGGSTQDIYNQHYTGHYLYQ